MSKSVKKAVFLFIALVFSAVSLLAQQNHFIYLQTENKQPFYVKLDKKVLSSSVSGYLIIPKLQDSAYQLTIGFPKNEWPEQNVTCNINKKDAGYLLKNFGDKGWGLFNLQTMEVVTSGTKPIDNKTDTDDNKNDVFSNTLSNVVNDPSITKKSGAKPSVKEESKSIAKEEVKSPVKEEAKPVTSEEIKPATETIKKEELVKSPIPVKKILSSKTAEGAEMIYVDIANGTSDTIRVFIPAEKKDEAVAIIPEKKTEIVVSEPQKKEEVKSEEIKKTDVPKEEIKKEEIKKTDVPKEEVKKEEIKKADVPKEEAKKEEIKKVDTPKEEIKNNDPKFIDIELPNPNAKKDTAAKQTAPVTAPAEKKVEVIPVPEKPKENPIRPVIANSDCRNFAAEEDFLKLRKKMVAENNDDDMIDVAKKVFRSKCFTTEQIKNLSVLFLKDEGKYKFFDTAYPFVSDSYNFGSLETQLTDNYFITRFKAMIHH